MTDLPERVKSTVACKHLGISRTELYRMIARGEIASIKPGRTVYIPVSEIRRLCTGIIQARPDQANSVAGGVAGTANQADKKIDESQEVAA